MSVSEKIDSGSWDKELYRELCREVLDRKTLSNIRRGTAKGLGIVLNCIKK